MSITEGDATWMQQQGQHNERKSAPSAAFEPDQLPPYHHHHSNFLSKCYNGFNLNQLHQ